MMLRAGLTGSLVCLALLPALSCAEAREPILLRVPASIDVLADGTVAAVALEGELPTPITEAIKSSATQWRFQPVQWQGQSASGRTYSQLAVCVAEDGGKLRVSTELQELGPRVQKNVVPRYPVSALRKGQSGEFDVTFVVNANGLATLEGVETQNGRLKDFKSAIEEWIKGIRFQPEIINGQPVATRLQWPISFHTGAAEDKRKRAEAKQQDSLHPTCQAALGKQLAREAIALDSPFAPMRITGR